MQKEYGQNTEEPKICWAHRFPYNEALPIASRGGDKNGCVLLVCPAVRHAHSPLLRLLLLLLLFSFFSISCSFFFLCLSILPLTLSIFLWRFIFCFFVFCYSTCSCAITQTPSVAHTSGGKGGQKKRKRRSTRCSRNEMHDLSFNKAER